MADQRDSGRGQAPRPADQRGPARPGPEQPAPATSGQAGADETQIIDRGAPEGRTSGPAGNRPGSLGGVLDDTAILRVEPAAPNRPGMMIDPEAAAGPAAPSADETAVMRLPDPPAKAGPGPAGSATGTARPGTARPGGAIPTSGSARAGGAIPTSGSARPGGAIPTSGSARAGGAIPTSGSARAGGAIPATGSARPGSTTPAPGTARPGGTPAAGAASAGTGPRPSADATTPFRVPVIAGPPVVAGPPARTDRPPQVPPARTADDRTEAIRSAAPSGRATPAPAKPAPPKPTPDQTAVVKLPDEPWKPTEPAGSETEVVRLPEEPWQAPEPAGAKTEVVRLPDEPWKSPQPVGPRTEVLRRPGTVSPATDPTEVVRLPHSPTSAAKAAATAKAARAGSAAEQNEPSYGSGLGQAPWVLVFSAIGVLMVALAYAGGRGQASGYPDILYWAGQVVVFTPVVMRLLSRRLAGGTEAFVLVIGLAVNQYLLKWMYSPDQFRFPDELQHWLATTIINESGQLFQPNMSLPPAVHFPGLAEMGASVSELTGLSVTTAGLLVAGVARLCFVGAFFATVLRATRSPAIAGVSCAIYATALHYLFFNAMYLYQTAALPFLMLAVWAARRSWSGGNWRFALIAVIGIGMTTVSHHVTSFMLVLTLFLLAFTELITGKPRPWRVLVLPFVAVLTVVAWIALVARDVVDYLRAPVDQAVDAVKGLIEGTPDSGAAAASTGVPVVQLAIQGVGLLFLFALYIAVARDMIGRRERDAWRWALMIGAAVFFAGNGVRFVGSNGPEIAGRLTTFTYIPMAVVGAIGLVTAARLLPQRGPDGIKWLAPSPPPKPQAGALSARLLVGAVAITVLMIGARVGGWPPAASLLPGPYVAAGFERSVDAYGIDAAYWEYYVLGTDKRVGGDITAVSLSSTYGRQDPVREAAPLFYDTEWSEADNRLVEQVGLEYLVVDRRITETLPVNDAYFDNDPHAGQITKPMSVTEISKFDKVDRISRLYDNGNVRIYRMGQL